MVSSNVVYGIASPRSLGGVSLFDMGPDISPETVGSATSDPVTIQAACAQLAQAGFEILHVSRIVINIAGPREAFEQAFRTRVVEREIDLRPGVTATYLDSPDTDMLGLISTAGTPFAPLLEGICFETPRYYFAESASPPEIESYWHLKVPKGVADGVKASELHSLGIAGQGVRVAMIDSGWYRHAYFTAQNYTVRPVVLAPGAGNPEADESGHGTGESANTLAIAPGCDFIPIKMNFVNTLAAFDTAVAQAPDIITCSWGSHSPSQITAADIALSASIAAAIASGITVIFSAGNGHAGFPGQHPDVISAGGVYADEEGVLRASDYSSAFASTIFPGRAVPDVCGLVGMRPKAMYIMLPVQPGDNIDVGNAGNTFPNGDETAPDDGWAAFSGTSAAAPQLAGVAALVKQVAPGITPALMRTILAYTGRDVTSGSCSPVVPLNTGLPAGPGPDEATGGGLVDAFSAVVTAYLAAASGMIPSPGAADPIVAAYLQGMADAATALYAIV